MVYENANEAARAVREIIDSYWIKSISEEQAVRQIKEIVEIAKNRMRIYRGKKYTAVFENILGKRRLEEFDRLSAYIDRDTSSC